MGGERQEHHRKLPPLNMIRTTTAARPFSRGLANIISARAGYGPAIRKASVTSRFHSLAAKRPQVAAPQFRPVLIPQLRYATKTGVPKHDKIDVAAERKLGSKELESDPEAVTTDSSVRQVFESSQAPIEEEDNEVLRGVKQDLVSFNILPSAGLIDYRTETTAFGHYLTSIAYDSRLLRSP